MADMLAVHQAIVTRLTDYLTPKGAVFIDGVLPDGDEIPTVGPAGTVVPHVCFWMGDPDEHPRGQALDGAANALGLLPLTMLCVAANPQQLTQLRDLTVRALVGWELPDGSEISGNGALALAPAERLGKPQRFIRALGFWASVGASGAPAA